MSIKQNEDKPFHQFCKEILSIQPITHQTLKVIFGLIDLYTNCFLLYCFTPNFRESSLSSGVIMENYEFGNEWIQPLLTVYWLFDLGKISYQNRKKLSSFDFILVMSATLIDLVVLNTKIIANILKILIQATSSYRMQYKHSNYQNYNSQFMKNNQKNQQQQIDYVKLSTKYLGIGTGFMVPIVYIYRFIKIFSVSSQIYSDIKILRQIKVSNSGCGFSTTIKELVMELYKCFKRPNKFQLASSKVKSQNQFQQEKKEYIKESSIQQKEKEEQAFKEQELIQKVSKKQQRDNSKINNNKQSNAKQQKSNEKNKKPIVITPPQITEDFSQNNPIQQQNQLRPKIQSEGNQGNIKKTQQSQVKQQETKQNIQIPDKDNSVSTACSKNNRKGSSQVSKAVGNKSKARRKNYKYSLDQKQNIDHQTQNYNQQEKEEEITASQNSIFKQLSKTKTAFKENSQNQHQNQNLKQIENHPNIPVDLLNFKEVSMNSSSISCSKVKKSDKKQQKEQFCAQPVAVADLLNMNMKMNLESSKRESEKNDKHSINNPNFFENTLNDLNFQKIAPENFMNNTMHTQEEITQASSSSSSQSSASSASQSEKNYELHTNQEGNTNQRNNNLKSHFRNIEQSFRFISPGSSYTCTDQNELEISRYYNLEQDDHAHYCDVENSFEIEIQQNSNNNMTYPALQQEKQSPDEIFSNSVSSSCENNNNSQGGCCEWVFEVNLMEKELCIKCENLFEIDDLIDQECFENQIEYIYVLLAKINYYNQILSDQTQILQESQFEYLSSKLEENYEQFRLVSEMNGCSENLLIE